MGFDSSKNAIETDFPLTEISKIAKQESWRKELYRPPSYIHKWWARRLGTVFRSIVLGSLLEEDEDIYDNFYQEHDFSDKTVYDPMMGSGITVGEGVKLGAKTIGRDINPVAYQLVKTALQDYDREEIEEEFERIKEDVAEEIKSFYKTEDAQGRESDVLYYFWVKMAVCPDCESDVPLFKDTVFSKNAYPSKHPEAQSICLNCQTVNEIEYDDEETICEGCETKYNPQEGPARRTRATCGDCGNDFKIIDAIQSQEGPPKEKMYAKMVLTPDGEKVYQSIDKGDAESYNKAKEKLKNENLPLPDEGIDEGYNTDQIINYNYSEWSQLFNKRQLYTLGVLGRRIKQIEDEKVRSLFATLFSGTLEFNSMLCSFKGEGTGAVRHAFSHHVLKPEKTPLEANPWGTNKSSGAFSKLFESRVLRALDYKDDPFELTLEDGSTEKVYGINQEMNREVVSNFEHFKNEDSTYIGQGDSSETDIEEKSVDVVVTDPPFFDNVHYSQLADYFYSWQKQILDDEPFQDSSTRQEGEVQDTDSEEFSSKLGDVLKETNRVMKEDGILAFTFHHSNPEGWYSVIEALREAGFYVEKTHPIKSEMSTAVPKSQADEPINIDIVIVCRKIDGKGLREDISDNAVSEEGEEVEEIYNRFVEADIDLSTKDLEITLMASVIEELSLVKDIDKGLGFLKDKKSEIREEAESIVEV